MIIIYIYVYIYDRQRWWLSRAWFRTGSAHMIFKPGKKYLPRAENLYNVGIGLLWTMSFILLLKNVACYIQQVEVLVSPLPHSCTTPTWLRFALLHFCIPRRVRPTLGWVWHWRWLRSRRQWRCWHSCWYVLLCFGIRGWGYSCPTGWWLECDASARGHGIRMTGNRRSPLLCRSGSCCCSCPSKVLFAPRYTQPSSGAPRCLHDLASRWCPHSCRRADGTFHGLFYCCARLCAWLAWRGCRCRRAGGAVPGEPWRMPGVPAATQWNTHNSLPQVTGSFLIVNFDKAGVFRRACEKLILTR